MRILVTRTTRAAPDGVTVTTYAAGEHYELPEELAKAFIAEGWGRLPARGLAGGASNEKGKDLSAAPANKAFDQAPRNKRRRRRRGRANQRTS